MDLKNAKVEFHDNEPVTTEPSQAEKIQRKKLYIGIAFILILCGAGFVFALLMKYTVNQGAWIALSVYGIFAMTLIVTNILVNPTQKWRFMATVVFVVPAMALPFSVWNTLFLLLGSVFMMTSGEKIRRSLHNMCTMHVGQALQTGMGGMFLGMAIIISSQYFTLIAQYDVEELLPRMNSVMSTNGVIETFLPAQNNHSGVMTIDAFLEKFVAERMTADMTGDSSAIMESVTQTTGMKEGDLKNLLEQNPLSADVLAHANNSFDTAGKNIVVFAREDIGDVIGQPLTGEESVTDVLMLFAQAQMKKVIVGNALIAHSLPKILAILVFITIISFVVLLRIPVIWLTKGIFSYLRYTSLFHVEKRAEEVERISYNTYN